MPDFPETKPDTGKEKKKFSLEFFTKQKNHLPDARGTVRSILGWYTSPTVPTIRFTAEAGRFPCLEIGKRARKRENSVIDSMDGHGWEIPEDCDPILIKSGDRTEIGYLTHPKGITLTIKPEVQIKAVDESGNEIPGKYVVGSYCGTIGRGADIDDFNQSIEREKSGGWIIPLVIGAFAGMFIFAPIFAVIISALTG